MVNSKILVVCRKADGQTKDFEFDSATLLMACLSHQLDFLLEELKGSENETMVEN